MAALDPVIGARRGVWVAHGAGDADRETSDDEPVLPPKTLRIPSAASG